MVKLGKFLKKFEIKIPIGASCGELNPARIKKIIQSILP
tara:strand:- start:378 stop:494 length:117 start_codon:yes stop_codon:yes gene_type:complete